MSRTGRTTGREGKPQRGQVLIGQWLRLGLAAVGTHGDVHEAVDNPADAHGDDCGGQPDEDADDDHQAQVDAEPFGGEQAVPASAARACGSWRRRPQSPRHREHSLCVFVSTATGPAGPGGKRPCRRTRESRARKQLPSSAQAARFSPSTLRNDRTIRSAAPLSIRHLPVMEARAMTIPMAPATEPKASATRVTFAAISPGDNRLTSRAAVINARKAFIRSTRIIPTTTTMAIARIRNGLTVSILR